MEPIQNYFKKDTRAETWAKDIGQTKKDISNAWDAWPMTAEHTGMVLTYAGFLTLLVIYSHNSKDRLKPKSLETRTAIQSEALSFDGDSIPEVVYFDKGNKNYGLIKVKGKGNAYVSGPVVEQDGVPFIKVENGFYDVNGNYIPTSIKPEAGKK